MEVLTEENYEIKKTQGLLEAVIDSRLYFLLTISAAASLVGIYFGDPHSSMTGAILYHNYINNSNPNALFQKGEFQIIKWN